MKTILRIVLILLVASVVAGAFSLAVNNGSTTSASEQFPTITNSSGSSTTPLLTRPEGGDHDSGSISGGLGGVIGTLAKITGITILVVVIQKGVSQLSDRKMKLAQ